MYSSMLWRRLPSPSITPNELLEILTAHTNGYYVLPEEPYDEVFPNIFIGDSTTALCLHLLKRIGITHVLNAAWGKQRNLGMVSTSAVYYRSAGIEFFGIEALDMTVFPLYEHFYTGAEFIDQAMREGGKVLVHCGEGISRSSTLVLAYLMIKRGFGVQEAVRQVVKHRNILPNQGFLLQLCQLHDQLQSAPALPSSPRSPSSLSTCTVNSSLSASREATPSPCLRSSYQPPSSNKNLNHRARSPTPSPFTISERSTSSSPITRTTWSNGWSPPSTVRCFSPSGHGYVRSSNIDNKYRTSVDSLSSDYFTSNRSRRCRSVDRISSTGSSFANTSQSNKWDGSNVYNRSLISSYLGHTLPIH